MVQNPFTYVSEPCADGCGLPSICVDQPSEFREAVLSEVCGLILLPVGALAPTDWQTEAGWAGIVDNSSTAASAAKYLAIIGSFEPSEPERAELSGGRSFVNLTRRWNLTAEIQDASAAEVCLLNFIENSGRGLRVWLETRGGRFFGGSNGFSPIQRNAAPTWQRGGYERATISMQFLAVGGILFSDAPNIPTIPPVEPSECTDAWLMQTTGSWLKTDNATCWGTE